MRVFILIFFCLDILIVHSQNEVSNKFKLTGTITNRDTGYIILGYKNITGKRIRDTAILQKGKFKFEGEISEPTFASIEGYAKMIGYLNVNNTEIFIEPTTQHIELIENNYTNAKLHGSTTQSEYEILTITLDSIELRYKNLHNQIAIANDAYKIAVTETDKQIAEQKANELINHLEPRNVEIRKAIISFVIAHPNSYVSPYFFYSQAKQLPIDSAKAIFQSFTPRIQNSINGVFVADLFKQDEQNKIGKTPYNFNTLDLNGKQISLLSFKGKFLYIDFWASWCAPCRVQIPKLKQMFKEYHTKGLEILTISIDKDSLLWKKALAEEKLGNWYNILANKEIEDNYENVNNPIPSGMLIGQDGRIIWKTSNSETLESALKRIVNKK